MFMRKLILIAVVIFASPGLFAEKWQTEGEIDILTRVGSKPTSEQGQVGFSVPSLKLAAEYLVDTQSSVFFQVQLAQTRSTVSKKQQLDLTRAFYEWLSESDTWIIRYGLVRSVYVDQSEDLLDYDLVPEYKALARRFNYLPNSDLGLEIQYVPTSSIDISIGVFNGEENTQNEDGAHKDLYLTLLYDDSNFHFSVLGVRGAYDEYEKPFNIKERDMARAVWKGSWLELGVEGMQSKELSNATVAYGRAESWDGSLYPEVIVAGEGASAWVLLKIDSGMEFLARQDYLDPYKEILEDEIESESYAMILKDKGYSLVIGYSKTKYRELHSTLSPEKEFGFVGLRQIF